MVVVMAKRRRQIVVRFREDRGEWEVDYRDHHGKRHRPLFETEPLALGRAAELFNTLAQTMLVDDPDLTLSTYVIRWLAGAQELARFMRESSDGMRRGASSPSGATWPRATGRRGDKVDTLSVWMGQRGRAGASDRDPRTGIGLRLAGIEGAPRSGRGAERRRQLAPLPSPGKRRGKVQHEPPHRPFDPDPQLEQPFAQRDDLRCAPRRAPGCQP
jgi:hypothetical protein